MRARGLWTKVRVVVILNQLLGRVRRGEKFEKLHDKDKLLIEFVGVTGRDIRDEIRRVQEKFSAPTKRKTLLALTLRQKVYLALTEPSSGRLALSISALMFTLIFVSISSFIASTMPEHSGKASLDIIEMVCQLIFSLEYALKICCAPKRWMAVKDPLNLIDLASIIPWYAEIAISGLQFGYEGAESSSSTSSARVLRIFRLFRVIKVFRLGSRAKKIQVVLIAVQDSADMFVVLGFLLALGLVMFSALMYFAENGQSPPTNAWDANEGDEFDSIPSAFWWCMVTLMTVGYGDAVPTTIWGKSVAAITMLGSVVITALPISVIGANFTQQWLAFKAKEHRKVVRLNIKDHSELLLKEMYAYSQVVSALSDHISAIQNAIIREVGVVRKLLDDVLQMAPTSSQEEVTILARTVDYRFSKIEDMKEELEELVETYDLVSHTEFSVSLQELKAIGNKMRKLEETGSLLDDDVETLVQSTSALRSQLARVKEILDHTRSNTPMTKAEELASEPARSGL